MSSTLVREPFAVSVANVSGQKVVRAAGISPATTVGELVQGLIPKMDLLQADADGRKIAYHCRLERLGRHLHPTEIVGDVLEPDDRLVLQPNIVAGAC